MAKLLVILFLIKLYALKNILKTAGRVGNLVIQTKDKGPTRERQ